MARTLTNDPASASLSDTAETLLLLERIQRRVLWLAAQQVHYANHVRKKADGIKVGGHQASCASVVTIMTSLYFRFLRRGDLLSVKPHASPVFHAIQFLLGNLDGQYLRRLRDFHGLQAYPSRTKDPDAVDFSTGSVGLGAVAPNFAALVDAYLRTHSFASEDPARRFISLVGDAELDEGSVWEAIAEPAMADASEVLWIVDLNRQSLDRVIPGVRVRSWREMFAANGWQVVDVKYGRKLQSAFEEPNGELLRICIDELSNDAYQRLLRLPPRDLRQWLPKKSRHQRDLRRLLDRWDDAQLHELFWNLGGTISSNWSTRSHAPPTMPARRSSSPTRSKAGGCRRSGIRKTIPCSSTTSRWRRCAAHSRFKRTRSGHDFQTTLPRDVGAPRSPGS